MPQLSTARAGRLVTLAAATAVAAASLPGPAVQASTAVYVSTKGSDTAAGTLTAPWRTLQYAMNRVGAGQTLYVRGGTYTENVKITKPKQGTSSARVTVMAYPGERPVIHGLLWLSSPRYWTLDGVNVTWNDANGSSLHMVKVTNGVGWIVRNSEFWGARSFANLLIASTVAAEPANWLVTGNCIHTTRPTNSKNQDHNIYVNARDGRGGIIERNLIFGAPNGQNVKVGPGTTNQVGPIGVVVRYNTMYDARYNIGVHWSATGTRIERNILVRSGSNHGNIHSYELAGTGNQALANLGHAAYAGRLITASPGSRVVADGGGNVYPRDPRFNSLTSCAGFVPADSTAAAYGRYAGMSTTSR